MQMAVQIGSTFAQAHVIDKKGDLKCPVAIPVHLTHLCDDYALMELGSTATFCGKCHLVVGFAIRHRNARRVNRHLPTPVPITRMEKASSRPSLTIWNK